MFLGPILEEEKTYEVDRKYLSSKADKNSDQLRLNDSGFKIKTGPDGTFGFEVGCALNLDTIYASSVG